MNRPSLSAVDVVLSTYNSNAPVFRLVLAAMRDELPVHHLINVDRSSKDGTPETVKEFFPDAVIISTEERLARARMRAVETVDTEYFVFVDDNVILQPGWFGVVGKCFANPSVGAAYGARGPLLYGYCRVIDLWDTIVKTEAARDWNPPWWLSAGENLHLGNYIKSKGYKLAYTTAVVPEGRPLTGSLLMLVGPSFRKGRWLGAGRRAVGISLGSMVYELSDYALGMLISPGSGKGKRVALALATIFGETIGYLARWRYLDLSRDAAWSKKWYARQ